jgi:acyl-CoA-binding protein
MWAATGGLDFNAREMYEERAKLKGKTKLEAKRAFLAAYARAMDPARSAENFRVVFN